MDNDTITTNSITTNGRDAAGHPAMTPDKPVKFHVPNHYTPGPGFDTFQEAVDDARSKIVEFDYSTPERPARSRKFIDLRMQINHPGGGGSLEGSMMRWEVFVDRVEICWTATVDALPDVEIPLPARAETAMSFAAQASAIFDATDITRVLAEAADAHLTHALAMLDAIYVDDPVQSIRERTYLLLLTIATRNEATEALTAEAEKIAAAT